MRVCLSKRVFVCVPVRVQFSVQFGGKARAKRVASGKMGCSAVQQQQQTAAAQQQQQGQSSQTMAPSGTVVIVRQGAAPVSPPPPPPSSLPQQLAEAPKSLKTSHSALVRILESAPLNAAKSTPPPPTTTTTTTVPPVVAVTPKIDF